MRMNYIGNGNNSFQSPEKFYKSMSFNGTFSMTKYLNLRRTSSKEIVSNISKIKWES